MLANGYNLIVKADGIEDAAAHVDEWLSVPVERGTLLGYGEVMVSIETDADLTAGLHKWHAETRPADGPYPPGALIWWKGNE